MLSEYIKKEFDQSIKWSVFITGIATGYIIGSIKRILHEINQRRD